MKNITKTAVLKAQAHARKIEREHPGESVTIVFNRETGQFTFCEMTGNSYMDGFDSTNVCIPSARDLALSAEMDGRTVDEAMQTLISEINREV